jgi:hypothetical protein
MGKRKNPNNIADKEKCINELMGHWEHISEIADRTLVSDLYNKTDNASNLFLPLLRVFPKTVGLDLVEVKPMSLPNGMLHYFDISPVYTDEEQIDMDAEKWMRKNVEWAIIKK